MFYVLTISSGRAVYRFANNGEKIYQHNVYTEHAMRAQQQHRMAGSRSFQTLPLQHPPNHPTYDRAHPSNSFQSSRTIDACRASMIDVQHSTTDASDQSIRPSTDCHDGFAGLANDSREADPERKFGSLARHTTETRTMRGGEIRRSSASDKMLQVEILQGNRANVVEARTYDAVSLPLELYAEPNPAQSQLQSSVMLKTSTAFASAYTTYKVSPSVHLTFYNG
jgi:hypothetical protein